MNPLSLFSIGVSLVYEYFTDEARKVMQLANQEAITRQHEYIGTEHILFALAKNANGIAATVLKSLNLSPERILAETEKIVQPGPNPVSEQRLPQTPRAKKIIEFALMESRELGHNYIGAEHLLLGMLREQEGVAAQVLMNLGLKLETVRAEILFVLSPMNTRPESNPVHESVIITDGNDGNDEEASKPDICKAHSIILSKKYGIDSNLEELLRVRFNLSEDEEIGTVIVTTKIK